jgi:hypothetical protein
VVVTACTLRETVVMFVKLPDVPVMVTVTVPGVAVPLAVSVNVLALVALLGLKAAVTPLGSPVADKPTLPLNPFWGVTVIVLVPLAPCVMVTLLGDAERAKFAGATAVTVRETVVKFDKLPDTPVMVTVAVPVVAVPLATRVSVLVLVATLGLKDAVTPLGRPEADKLTLPVNPFWGVTVIMLVPLVPCAIVILLGEAERTKFAGATAVTVRETVVVFDKLPDAPVIVTVAVPAVAVLLAVRVKVLVPVVLVGLNDAETPLGRPDAVKLTLPLKLFCGVTEIVLVPLPPCGTVTLLGDDESEKFGGGATGAPIETLSNVAVARTVVLPLSTAKPTNTV